MCPGTAGAQSVRNGCRGLGRDGLVESLGSASRTSANGNLVSERLWSLTGPGLEAAAAVLDRPVGERGRCPRRRTRGPGPMSPSRSWMLRSPRAAPTSPDPAPAAAA
ncbi:hypothetical protein AB0C95_12745, partial [Streptomyces caniferus]|uniref:hypothetical protein n=1 Tax=Streptomyces caniferus TaxID=285557 RepID=UPI00340A6E65